MPEYMPEFMPELMPQLVPEPLPSPPPPAPIQPCLPSRHLQIILPNLIHVRSYSSTSDHLEEGKQLQTSHSVFQINIKSIIVKYLRFPHPHTLLDGDILSFTC